MGVKDGNAVYRISDQAGVQLGWIRASNEHEARAQWMAAEVGSSELVVSARMGRTR
ncbi:hypothetical protein [Curtobacterium sp. MCBD17_040]|uniref:hypothetical protein n=1 Tax=Curtobacterium sp. MCBD17_040 TaxID=2175674 RepID=UPI0015E8A96F|nr:hypothetical protein [Curtobacterium sp. MCBD17_040]WIB65384.1 hypothetical protein DEI94_18425 [Curtobacterium sp. MCBD17_040]